MKKLLLLLVCCVGMSAMAQNADTTELKTTIEKTPFITDSRTFGIELDVLPYITGGYYASLWYGKDHLRYRAIYAHSNIPSFAIPEGFKNHKLWVGAFVVDYFFKENFEGWWVGAGYEYWDSQIEDEAETQRLYYTNNVMTFGGGYVWKFAGNFYLNPWGAAHILITNHGPFQLGGQSYEPAVFVPEISLKVGWHL